MRAFIRGDTRDGAVFDSKMLSLEEAAKKFYHDPNLFPDSSDDDHDLSSSDDSDGNSDGDDCKDGETKSGQHAGGEDKDDYRLFRPNSLPDMPKLVVRQFGKLRKPQKITVLTKLMEHSHDIHSKDAYGNNAMHWACHALNTIPDVDEYSKRLLKTLSNQLALLRLKDLNPLEYSKRKRKIKKKRIENKKDVPMMSQLPREKLEQYIIDIEHQLLSKESQRQNRCLALIEKLQRIGGNGMMSIRNFEGTVDDAVLLFFLLLLYQLLLYQLLLYQLLLYQLLLYSCCCTS